MPAGLILNQPHQHDAEPEEDREHDADGGVFFDAGVAAQAGDNQHAGDAGGERAQLHCRQVAAADDEERDAQAGERGMGQRVSHQRAAAEHGEAADQPGASAEQTGAEQDDGGVVADHGLRSRARMASAASSSTASLPP
jgi:hypothetical protein